MMKPPENLRKCFSRKGTQLKYYFVCHEDNELYKMIKDTGVTCYLSSSVNQVLSEITQGSYLCVFEDGYPQKKTVITKEHLEFFKDNNIKVLLEYPKQVYGIHPGKVIRLDRERLVEVTSLMIGQNNCDYVIPYAIEEKFVLYYYAKVAGYKKAVYGLPDITYPFLFYHPAYVNVVMTSSRISSPVTSRFKPVSFFKNLYNRIFSMNLTFTESVTTAFKSCDNITDSDCITAISKSVEWFTKYMLTTDYTGLKLYEGFSSKVDFDGSQKLAATLRNDCAGEASLLFAVDYLKYSKPSSKDHAEKLMEYIFSANNQQLDMTKDNGGFIKWFASGDGIYYTDDNARLLIGVMTSCSILKMNHHDEGIIKCILAFLRSMPEQGIHMNCLRFNDSMIADDWTYHDIKTKKTIYYSPHYVSYIWAVFLLAYKLTNDEELLAISKKGIYEMMDKYPCHWTWTNGIMAEVSRMILPLSLLYSIDKDLKTKEYLDMMLKVIKEQTDDHGCMIEKMVMLENGKYPPPKNNEEYGKYEAPVIHEDGDTACDLLYSQNFAYLGLLETCRLYDDESISKLFTEMTDFLVRIQTRSSSHQELDGVWMRSFDPTMWEYWGSGADAGWAALCVESGWTNSWIPIVLSLKEQNRSLSDFFTDNESFKELYYLIKGSI
ncbi:MAG: hypothetical protein JXQ23_03710 [Clostridia bacterium]|nr:hypothetical protein [Clostridia bacterium]